MTATDDDASFSACRAGVQALLDARAGVDDLERTIEALSLPVEERCALWLWACARAAGCCGHDVPDAEDRRRLVIERLIAHG